MCVYIASSTLWGGLDCVQPNASYSVSQQQRSSANINHFLLLRTLSNILRTNYLPAIREKILIERRTGRNEHGIVVEWISACVCLVLACSSSWYVLYLFVRFSFGLLSTCVTNGWIFEISLCENSINQSFNQLYQFGYERLTLKSCSKL